MLPAMFFWDLSFVSQKPTILTLFREMLQAKEWPGFYFLLDLASKLVIKSGRVGGVNERPSGETFNWVILALSTFVVLVKENLNQFEAYFHQQYHTSQLASVQLNALLSAYFSYSYFPL